MFCPRPDRKDRPFVSILRFFLLDSDSEMAERGGGASGGSGQREGEP